MVPGIWKECKKYIRTLPVFGSKSLPGEAEGEASEKLYKRINKVAKTKVKEGGDSKELLDLISDQVGHVESYLKGRDFLDNVGSDREDAWRLVADKLVKVDKKVHRKRLEDAKKRLAFSKLTSDRMNPDLMGPDEIEVFRKIMASKKKRKKRKKRSRRSKRKRRSKTSKRKK